MFTTYTCRWKKNRKKNSNRNKNRLKLCVFNINPCVFLRNLKSSYVLINLNGWSLILSRDAIKHQWSKQIARCQIYIFKCDLFEYGFVGYKTAMVGGILCVRHYSDYFSSVWTLTWARNDNSLHAKKNTN